MSVGVRRSNLEIIRDILREGRGGSAQLRYQVNLSHLQLRRYLEYLEGSRLVRLERRKAQVVNIQVTDKGLETLELLDRLFSALDSDSSA